MGIQALGKIAVPTPGTPVQISTTVLRGSWFTLAPNPANAGKIYLGNKNMNKVTGVGLIAILVATSNPFQIFTNGLGIDPEDLWLDADNANESGLASLAA